MEGPLPAAVAKMRMYMANPSTHAVLLRPIKVSELWGFHVICKIHVAVAQRCVLARCAFNQ